MRIVPPTQCPSCHSELIQKNSILYCVNRSCEGQGAKLIENFAKVLKIKGLGPSTIEKLNVTTIDEIYSLSLDYIVSCIGAALGNKLKEQIEISKNSSLNEVLPALGIPLIGKTAAEKICAEFTDIHSISLEKVKDILGPKAYENFASWYLDGEWEELPFKFDSKKAMPKPLNSKTVCITGKLSSFKTKAEAAKYLIEKGYTVADSITKTTNILVNESGIESEKTKKARANGTQIVNNILEL